jgi:hypothetical protein
MADFETLRRPQFVQVYSLALVKLGLKFVHQGRLVPLNIVVVVVAVVKVE